MKFKLVLITIVFALSFGGIRGRNLLWSQQDDVPEQKNIEGSSGEEEKDKGEDGQSANEKEDVDQPDKKSKVRRRKPTAKAFSKQNEEFVSVFSTVVASTTDSVVRIFDEKKQIALGTVVDSEGYILSKASELKGDLKCQLLDGSKIKPNVIGIDPETDLVLLKIEQANLPVAKLDEGGLPQVGSWLATVDQNGKSVSVGIVSHEARTIKSDLPNNAVMGIIPDLNEQSDSLGVRINRVFEDTPAERAGLLVNDVIISIDEVAVNRRTELMDTLSNYEPGDEIAVVIKRGDKEMTVMVTLGKRKVSPMMDRGTVQNRMGSTLSKRRTDFPLAIQHDSSLNANECGGPVVDLSGRVIGINIARDGRVSSLALPNEVVLPVIAKLKTGQFKPEVVNKKEIERVERELERLAKDIGNLPEEKMEMELKFSAGSAIENELQRQIKEAEERIKELKSRFEKQKGENNKLGDSIADMQNKKNRIERKREPLEAELKMLRTGVK